MDARDRGSTDESHVCYRRNDRGCFGNLLGKLDGDRIHDFVIAICYQLLVDILRPFVSAPRSRCDLGCCEREKCDHDALIDSLSLDLHFHSKNDKRLFAKKANSLFENKPDRMSVIEITRKVLDVCHARFYREIDACIDTIEVYDKLTGVPSCVGRAHAVALQAERDGGLFSTVYRRCGEPVTER